MSKDFLTTPATAVSYLNTAGGTNTVQETMNTTQMNRTMKTNSDDNNSVHKNKPKKSFKGMNQHHAQMQEHYFNLTANAKVDPVREFS